MCGRAKQSTDFSEIKVAFGIPPEYPTPNTYKPSWNVAPTDSLPIVRYNPKTASRTMDMMRWGLVPYWAKDLKIGFSTINAMAETIDSKPVFREAFQRRRCLVPVDAFYEWKKLDPTNPKGEKQPYALALKAGGLMAMAGLWENWKSPSEEWVRSFTIVTTTANELCAEIHNRMPAILSEEVWASWLGEEAAVPEPHRGKRRRLARHRLFLRVPAQPRAQRIELRRPQRLQPTGRRRPAPLCYPKDISDAAVATGGGRTRTSRRTVNDCVRHQLR